VAELAAEFMPRSEFVSSRTTGVGLTAAADRDDLSGWSIKSGAIVRANNGMLVIDELDKIDESEIEDLHTPMAKQTVEAAVADQKVSLPAETSVLTTANPKPGRFDEFEPIGEQFDMPPSLLSRFDLIVTLTDQPDVERDGKLASSVMDGFQSALQAEREKSGQGSVDDNVGFLRAWVAEARGYLPEFPDEAKTRLRNFYQTIRQEGDDEDSPVPVSARQIEGMMRLATASARARHSDAVEDVDVDRAIWLVKQTLQDVGIDPETGELDADLIETGNSKSQRDRRKIVRTTVRELCREHETGAPYAEIVEEMVADGISEEKAEHAIEKIVRKGELYEPEENTYRVT
jgi:replicative DNA helicase Mcm